MNRLWTYFRNSASSRDRIIRASGKRLTSLSLHGGKQDSTSPSVGVLPFRIPIVRKKRTTMTTTIAIWRKTRRTRNRRSRRLSWELKMKEKKSTPIRTRKQILTLGPTTTSRSPPSLIRTLTSIPNVESDRIPPDLVDHLASDATPQC